MNTGAKETAATLILGYAPPSRADFQQRMIVLLACMVAAIPFLHLASYVPYYLNDWIHRDLKLFPGAEPVWANAGAILLFAVEPLAAALVIVAAVSFLVRRRLGLLFILAILVYLPIAAAQESVEELLNNWLARQLPLFQLSLLIKAISNLAKIALPLLLLALLSPKVSRTPDHPPLMLHLLILAACTFGAARMVYTWCTTPGIWNGPIVDFWNIYDGNLQGPLVCIGQLSLNIAVLLLVVQLALALVARRAKALLLRASTTLLLTGWAMLLLAGVLTRLHISATAFPGWGNGAIYSAWGFLSLPLNSTYYYPIAARVAEGVEFLASAGLGLVFILSLRIAINRPELLWNRREK